MEFITAIAFLFQPVKQYAAKKEMTFGANDAGILRICDIVAEQTITIFSFFFSSETFHSPRLCCWSLISISPPEAFKKEKKHTKRWKFLVVFHLAISILICRLFLPLPMQRAQHQSSLIYSITRERKFFVVSRFISITAAWSGKHSLVSQAKNIFLCLNKIFMFRRRLVEFFFLAEPSINSMTASKSEFAVVFKFVLSSSLSLRISRKHISTLGKEIKRRSEI